jgi:methyltransferase (TIGR00027 family)
VLHHGPGALLADPLAWPFVGADADAVLAGGRALIGDREVPFSTWFAARSRMTEDWLAASGAQQYVILGAGLDSFAWRQSAGVRVFEVDHPSTQAWKQARASTLGLPSRAELAWVPVDFEHQQLGPALAQAGLDAAKPIFVSWLGVVPYLTRDAIVRTLRELPRCSLAVGYVPPATDWDDDARPAGAAVEARARELGEPWLTLVTRTEFAALLSEGGFTVAEDVGAHDVETSYGLPAINYERMALARN